VKDVTCDLICHCCIDTIQYTQHRDASPQRYLLERHQDLLPCCLYLSQNEAFQTNGSVSLHHRLLCVRSGSTPIIMRIFPFLAGDPTAWLGVSLTIIIDIPWQSVNLQGTSHDV